MIKKISPQDVQKGASGKRPQEEESGRDDQGQRRQGSEGTEGPYKMVNARMKTDVRTKIRLIKKPKLSVEDKNKINV